MGFSLDPDRERTPRRLGAVLGLFDRPLHRDWLPWWTAFWVVVAVLSQVFPADDTPPATSLPVGLNALLSALVIGFFLGFLPAYIRLLLRRRRIRRHAAAFPARAATGPSAPSIPGRESKEPNQPQRPPTAPGTATAPGTSDASSARASRGSPPASIDALDVSVLRNSDLLSNARRVMPYPVARAVRAIQHSTDMKDAYETVLRGSEALSIVLGVTAVTWARSREVTTPQLGELHGALVGQGASQGHWIAAAQSIGREMSGHPDAVPGMSAALKSGKGGTWLVSDLKELVAERNRWAHGGGPRNGLEAAERLQTALPLFQRALEAVAFLGDSAWILPTDSKLRRREGDFQIQASRAMGDHPDFDVTVFTTPQPLAEEVFYLSTPHDVLDMTPLVVLRPCPTCHQREVAYADRLDDKRGVALKTFDRGHVLFDPALVEELRHLLPGDAPSAAGETA